jgi:hypothetical protein
MMMEETMRGLTYFIALSSMLVFGGPVLAQDANEGQPFGQVVSQAAKDGEIKEAVHENGPGGLDDVIQSNLADDEEAGTVRGHGRIDAPGHK